MKWPPYIILFYVYSAFAAPMMIGQPWPEVSDPKHFDHQYNFLFGQLPLHGKVNHKSRLWSGDYWPLKRGSINYRWYGPVKGGFNMRSPNRHEAARMNITELAALSPAEKYDLFTGRYDYPLKAEVSQQASPRALSWEGICHGWAPASINHNEPMPKLLKNPQGIEVPFGSTDIKALLSYYYANGFQTSSVQMGLRCYPSTREGCQDDLNAGAFHVVLANIVGTRGGSFIVDLDKGGEVWNSPVYAYSSTLLGELPPAYNSAPGTIKVLRLRTSLSYIENGDNNWRPLNGTQLHAIKMIQYNYDLDIDSSGKIVGGSWRSRSRPDFMWQKSRPYRYTGLLFRLGELLDD